MDKQDVFISYSTKNQFEADLVKKVLTNNGISCWMAPDSIPTGSNYAREIPAGIRNARVFVLLVSSAAQASQWVPRELDLAVNEEKVILPFMLEDCELLDEFNFYLVGAQRLDAYLRMSDALQTLVSRVRAILQVESVAPADLNERDSLPTKISTEEWERVLAAFAGDFIRNDMITGRKEYRVKKVDNLRRYMEIPEEAEIFLAYDDSVLKSGSDGFAITSSGFFCRDIMKEVSKLRWKDFMKAEKFEFRDFLFTDLYACIPDGDVQIGYINSLTPEPRKVLVRFLERLRDAMRERFGDED